ncbi:hypothetical protein PACTADRAFT_49316 [Pachysolen tannophilus NRRL Y-2460]|uniref:Uncharacterized protein n=1 Tax=Pachysolen tannophilus NRRL Y-2460 TaxID=669874 RepID=A0A1E4TVV9_PACTA|nr:hypothetical protein PACTADRAFT_49316 [Pachysolen tannophilus NRRL Y-2460]
MGKIVTSDAKTKAHRASLYNDISNEGILKNKSKKKSKHNKKAGEDEDEDGDKYLDAAVSRKILQLAKEQQEEIAEEENGGANGNKFSLSSRIVKGEESQEEEDDDEEDDDDEEEEGKYSDFELEEEEYYGEEADEEEEINEDDIAMFESYFKASSSSSSAPFSSFNLADKVMAKLQEQQDQKSRDDEDGESLQARQRDKVLLPPKVIEVYTKIGQVLKNYRRGKLPKLFKVIPSLRNWEDVLYVTNPQEWSPQACYEATKLFVSNLTSRQAEKFVHNILLDRFRDNIEDDENHKLNYHLYRSLKKSLYKPAAFFKGFLYPLVEENCTLRESIIAGSILSKVSIPVVHSSLALSWLTEQPFQPATMVFIRILLEKKYALPYQTVDHLVFYFMNFRILNNNNNNNNNNMDMDMDMGINSKKTKQEAPPLPLVWHKAFLAFAQRYKNDITEDQRDFLLETVRQRGHDKVGPEIRRELLAGKVRPEVEKRGNSANNEELMVDVF